MPKLLAGHDHGWDAVRYALAPKIKRSGLTAADLYGQHGLAASLMHSEGA